MDLLGQFDDPDNWRPVSGSFTILTIKSWELIVEGEEDVVRSRSCLGGGDFADPFVQILVERTN